MMTQKEKDAIFSQLFDVLYGAGLERADERIEMVEEYLALLKQVREADRAYRDAIVPGGFHMLVKGGDDE